MMGYAGNNLPSNGRKRRAAGKQEKEVDDVIMTSIMSETEAALKVDSKICE